MADEILAILESMITKALKMGADEVELFAQKKKEKRIFLESNNLKSAISNILEGVGIRVLCNKSLGFSSVNSLDRLSIENGLKEALAIAKVTPPEDSNKLPSKQNISQIPELYDPSIEDFSMSDLIRINKEALELLSDIDSRINIESAAFTAMTLVNAIATTTGITSSESNTILSWDYAGMAIDGEDIGSWDFVSNSVVKVKDINIEETLRDFAQKVLGNLQAKKTDSFIGPAVFSPEAVYDLFDIIIDSATATSIQSGSSYLQDKLGEKIAVEELTIIDDGTMKNSCASNSFDREGLPHKKLKIIDKGIFTGILYNAFTANKENLQSTSHARGDFRSIPQIGPTNVTITLGNQKIEEIISNIKHGVYVKRISASPDYVSGDFSAALKGGKLIKNGEITDTLKEITAVGNIYTGLQNIIAISKEQKALKYGSESFFAPYIVLNEIKFTC